MKNFTTHQLLFEKGKIECCGQEVFCRVNEAKNCHLTAEKCFFKLPYFFSPKVYAKGSFITTNNVKKIHETP